MSYQYLEMGIEAVRKGSLDEGMRLLRMAIKSDELTIQLKAVAYMWLAETQTDPAQKRALYQQARDADPNNADIAARVDRFLQQQFPPPPSSLPEAPPQPTTLPGMPSTATQQVSPFTQPTGATPNPYAASAPASPNLVNYPSQMATGAPAMPNAPVQAPPPAQILAPQTGTVLDYIVNIIGGPNGAGSGFYANQQPIIVTTRHVVGGSDQITIEFSPGRQTLGTVVRCYTDYDLALIALDYAPPAALPATPMPRVPDDAVLTAVTYGGTMTRGQQRPTRRVLAAHWIPTDYNTLPDAGGAPLFDQNNYLVGMLTRNTSRSADHFFGLHISLIRHCIDSYLQEAGAVRTAYCPQCGTQSRAGGQGFFFCETCGSVMPSAQNMTLYPIPQAENYYSQTNAPRCPYCQAAVGYHNGKCLRCGQPAG